MRTVGLTGGIASGKSTVSRMLAELGAPVIDADLLARTVVEPGKPALRAIIKEFGPDVLRPDGTLDRGALGLRVFADSAARRRLEEITHPEIRVEMKAELDRLRAADAPVAVADIPLLIENGTYKKFDEVWLVWVDQAVQLARLMARDRLSLEAAKLRLAAQMPLDDKRRFADVIINNQGTLNETRRQVETHWQAVNRRASRGGAH